MAEAGSQLRNQPQDHYEEFYEFVTKLNCSRNLKFLLVNEGVSQAMAKRKDCLSYYKRIYADFFMDDARFKMEIDRHLKEKVKHCLDVGSLEKTRREKRLREVLEVVQLQEMQFKPWNYRQDLKCIFNLAFTVKQFYGVKEERLVQPALFNVHVLVSEKLLKLQLDEKVPETNASSRSQCK